MNRLLNASALSQLPFLFMQIEGRTKVFRLTPLVTYLVPEVTKTHAGNSKL